MVKFSKSFFLVQSADIPSFVLIHILLLSSTSMPYIVLFISPSFSVYLLKVSLFLMGKIFPGNYLMKLKPVDLNTEKNIDFKQSFLRHLLDPIDMSLFGLVGIIIIKNSPESQRLGDLLAKTKVIKLTE